MSKNPNELLSVYKASAGSGKTFTLTLRYLTLLLDASDPDDNKQQPRLNHRDFGPVRHMRHRGILAITFTNKATGEMKDRIINELRKLARFWNDPEQRKHSDMETQLRDTFGCTPQQLGEAADNALRELLHDFSGFNVSTIDSFFQQVMRNLAYELDYPGDYDVTLDEDAVIAESAKMMLDDFNHLEASSPVRSNIERIMKDVMHKGRTEGLNTNVFQRNSHVHRNLTANAKNLFDENYKLVSTDFDRWFAQSDCFSKFRKFLADQRAENTSTAEKALTELEGLLNQYGVYDYATKHFKNLLNECRTSERGFLGANGKPKTVFEYLCGSAETITKLFTKKAADLLSYDVCDAIYRVGNRYASAVIALCNIDMIERENRMLHFVLLLNTYIKRFRRDNNVVVLADTAELLHRMMGEDQVPFVYEKMGVNLRNFLIDEFQDTSHMQWNNLHPLVEEAMSKGHPSLIIGDEKQAIYRFRNSDSDILHSTVPQQFAGRIEAHGDKISENTNWRSARHIVAFNNTLFHRLGKTYGIASYDNVIQRISKAKLDGYVRFFNCIEAENKAAVTAAENSEPEQTSQTRPQKEVLIQEIRRQTAAGYKLSDIAILAAKNSQVVEVAKWLQEADINVLTDEALMVSNSQAVRNIVGILGMIARGTIGAGIDNGSQYRKVDVPDLVRRYDMAYEKALLESNSHTQATMVALRFAIPSQGATDDEHILIKDVLADKASTLTSLVENVISRGQIDIHKDEIAFVACFHDIVADFTATYGNDLAAFLRWWDQTGRNTKLASVDGADAVRLMTIHKSKGLEWPCVHIPFGGQKLGRESIKAPVKWLQIPQELQDKGMPPAIRICLDKFCSFGQSQLHDTFAKNEKEELTDGLNRTYVAYTRAGRELCVYLHKETPFTRQLFDCAATTMSEEEMNVSAEIRRQTSADTDADTIINLAQYTDTSAKEITIGQATTPEVAKKTVTTDHTFPSPESYYINTGDKYNDITAVESLYGPETSVNDDDDPSVANSDHEPGSDFEIDPELTEAGIRVHRLLSRINRLDDLEPTLNRYAARYGLTADECQSLRQFFHTHSDNPLMQTWFGGQEFARNEMPVYKPDAQRGKYSTRRLDRVVWTPDGQIHILDYKTSSEPHSGHRTQIRQYGSLIAEAYPGQPIRLFLLYTSYGEIQEVKP